jgi:hypothetical protein
MEAPETNTVLGIAKRLNKDLEDLPIASHAAVINILTTLLQHRADCEQSRAREEQRKAQIAAQFSPGPGLGMQR